MRRMYAFARLSLLFAAAFHAPLDASVFDRDDRVTVAADLHGSTAPIGTVWADKLMATGFLVGPCHVLTVRHVFHGDGDPIGRKAVFGALATGAGQWTASRATVVAAGQVAEDAPGYDGQRAADWVLLRLHTCLGKALGFATLAAETPLPVRELESAGYPYDRRDRAGMTLDPACRVMQVRGGIWLNDCAALSGNSGSPIFSEAEENGRTVLRVYAMQSAAYDTPLPIPFAAGSANVATPMAGIIPQIERAIGRVHFGQHKTTEVAAVRP